MIVFRPAKHQDAQAIRKIRNECRANFVDTRNISETDQEIFWGKYVMTGKYKIWVMCDDFEGKHIVGYYQARNFTKDSCEIGLGLTASARGKGFGNGALGSLRLYLIKAKIKKMWLTVRKSNKAGRALFEKQGFVPCEVQDLDGVIKMERETRSK